MSNRPIELGISTCPNDTFAFHALMNRCIDMRGLQFKIELCDVQELNDRLLRGDFDVAKTSFHAALLMTESTVVLASGSALGFGVGPLLLSRQGARTPDDFYTDANGTRRPARILCPGELTTATLLYRLFYPGIGELRQVVFSEIMPSLSAGTADFGVCIHEGRFTWQQAGLDLVEDLGSRWERKTETPLPLGGIVARRSLPNESIDRIQSVIFDSIQFARENREPTLPTMRKYAQEFSDEVLMAHVDLYVNDETVHLSAQGRKALDSLFRMAIQTKLIPESGPPLEVFSSA